MKLDSECIRDLMLFCEQHTYTMTGRNSKGEEFQYFHALSPQSLQMTDELKKYPLQTLNYHLVQLSESGYIVTDFKVDRENGHFILDKIFYITPKGHEFAAAIRNADTWKDKITPVLKQFGTISLAIIETIAKGITDAALKQLLS